MNIGEAVKERILELCREHDISVNKLSSMSGVCIRRRPAAAGAEQNGRGAV